MIVFRPPRIIAGVGGPIAHEREEFDDLGWTPAAAVPPESTSSATAVMAGSRNLLADVSIPRIIFRPWAGICGRRELPRSAVRPQPLGIPSLERLGRLDERRVRVGLASAMLRRQGLKRCDIAKLPSSRMMQRIEPGRAEQGAEMARRGRLVSLA